MFSKGMLCSFVDSPTTLSSTKEQETRRGSKLPSRQWATVVASFRRVKGMAFLERSLVNRRYNSQWEGRLFATYHLLPESPEDPMISVQKKTMYQSWR